MAQAEPHEHVAEALRRRLHHSRAASLLDLLRRAGRVHVLSGLQELHGRTPPRLHQVRLIAHVQASSRRLIWCF